MRGIRLTMMTVGILAVSGFAHTAWAQSQGPTRIDFDDRLIKGQTKKAGAIYIYNRQSIPIRSLVNTKRTFRHKVIRTVF